MIMKTFGDNFNILDRSSLCWEGAGYKLPSCWPHWPHSSQLRVHNDCMSHPFPLLVAVFNPSSAWTSCLSLWSSSLPYPQCQTNHPPRSRILIAFLHSVLPVSDCLRFASCLQCLSTCLVLIALPTLLVASPAAAKRTPRAWHNLRRAQRLESQVRRLKHMLLPCQGKMAAKHGAIDLHMCSEPCTFDNMVTRKGTRLQSFRNCPRLAIRGAKERDPNPPDPKRLEHY